MDALPVTLIVKAPTGVNQQDQTVKCELSWTIRRLKGHLAEVYPCKPEEQKLIYSGQLLQDAVVLKDVLRQYDGQETHTVHLVYTPKQQQQQMRMDNKDSPSSSSTSSSSSPANPSGGDANASQSEEINSSLGLRRRNVGSTPSSTATAAGGASPSQVQQVQPPNIGGNIQLPLNLQASALYSQPFPSATAAAASSSLTATTTNLPTTSDQIASYQQWYQQQYLLYINQYMAYMATLQQQQQQPQQLQTNQFPMPWTVPSFIPVHQQGLPIVNEGSNGVGGANVAANPPPVGDAVQEGGQVGGGAAAAQPRFPLLVHEPDRPERDWLDYMYSFCRIGFLLIMIYLYSSALRFAVVMCAIFAIYLYRNRVALLGPGRVIEVPVPQIQQPVVVQGEGGEVAAAVPGVDPVAEGGIRPDTNNNNLDVANRNGNETENADQEQNSRTTVLSFMRTFVTSFFYSLLPEPALAP